MWQESVRVFVSSTCFLYVSLAADEDEEMCRSYSEQHALAGHRPRDAK